METEWHFSMHFHGADAAIATEAATSAAGAVVNVSSCVSTCDCC